MPPFHPDASAWPRPWSALEPASLRDFRPDPSPPGLDALSREAAARFGDAAAFAFPTPDGRLQSLSFAEVDALTDRLAMRFMRGLGVAPGTVVAIRLPNCLHYPLAVLAAWKAGAIVSNVNPLYTARELNHQLEDCGARVLITAPIGLDQLEQALADPNLRVVMITPGEALPFAELLAGDAPPSPLRLPPRARDAVALYQYTGGTTGRSKGAILTDRNLRAVLSQTWAHLAAEDGAPQPGETILTLLPMYHIFAFTLNFLLFFQAGARNLLIANPRPLATLEPVFRDHRIDWTTGVDTLFAGLLAEPWFIANPPRLRFAISGGTALRPGTNAAWSSRVGPVLEGYGMTETCCIIACNQANPALVRPGTVGIPIPGCEVRLVDDDGRPAAPGVPGEILVAGAHVVSGYLNAPAQTAEAFIDGWLRTGDIGVWEDGRLKIVDRKKDMILVSGFNVYPNEVEAVIAEHPAVVDVAVIGVPDDTTGEALRAFVSVSRETGAAELIAHCRKALTAYKVPKQVVFREALPKSPVGKILRAALR